MRNASVFAIAVLVAAVGLASANPGGTNVVINEVYCDPSGPGSYDGAEFIELYNPTASPIDIGGWVLTGTEYDQECGGEDDWSFPPGTMIAADGYIVVAKDAADEDGFFQEFGELPDFELVDRKITDSGNYDTWSGLVDTLILRASDQDTLHDDQILLVGGRGYGVTCGGYSEADVTYLYTALDYTELVDLVEYANMEICTSDPCPGDDGPVDNAFPEIPFAGNTLGRNTDSDDTDSSIDDFTLQAPTPGAPNVLNEPPWVREVRYAPIPPNATEPTQVSAIATDDGSIASVEVHYSVDGGAWDSVAANPMPEDKYVGLVPVQPEGSQVGYYVRAIDDQGAGTNYPGGGESDPYSYSVGYTLIEDIQNPGRADSPLVGQAVNILGRVTASEGTYASGVFMLHEGTGVYKGVKCYAPSYDGPIEEGDELTICGIVAEYYGETEIILHFEEALVVHSSGNGHYGYTPITSAQIKYGEDVEGEKYEGQLVSIADAVVHSEDIGYGMWTVYNTGSVADTCRVDDLAYYTYDPEVNDVMELRGTVQYSYGTFKVQPRYDEDIIGPPRIQNVRYSPAPVLDGNTVTMSADMIDDTAISAATLSYKSTSMGSYTTVGMTQGTGDEWSVDIGPFTDGQRVYYYMNCADGDGQDARRPGAGTFSFYVGMLTIAEVQTPDGGGDASQLDTLAVNVRGVVTAEPGVFSDYSFYIQDGEGPWNGVRVYDRTGSLTFNRGDEIVVCGEVEEYPTYVSTGLKETEIALHFEEAVKFVHYATPVPMWTTVLTPELQNVNTAEKYEGVLVFADDSTVVDPNLGYGEWSITNTGNDLDACIVDDLADYDYVPVEDDDVYVIGIVTYNFNQYMMEPRGNEDIWLSTGVDGEFERKFGLAQNMPNPFNPRTRIAFSIEQAGDVKLEVFNVAGQKVVTLVNEKLEAGPHLVDWNGRVTTGERAASGVYFYRLTAGDKETSKKMVLLK